MNDPRIAPSRSCDVLIEVFSHSDPLLMTTLRAALNNFAGLKRLDKSQQPRVGDRTPCNTALQRRMCGPVPYCIKSDRV